MLLRWDRQGTDATTPTPTFIEITLTPTGDGTNVRVQFSGLSAEDAAFYLQLWRVTLTGSRPPWLAPNQRMAIESGTASSERLTGMRSRTDPGPIGRRLSPISCYPRPEWGSNIAICLGREMPMKYTPLSWKNVVIPTTSGGEAHRNGARDTRDGPLAAGHRAARTREPLRCRQSGSPRCTTGSGWPNSGPSRPSAASVTRRQRAGRERQRPLQDRADPRSGTGALADRRRRRTGYLALGALVQQRAAARVPRLRAAGRVRGGLRCPQGRPGDGWNPITRVSIRPRADQVPVPAGARGRFNVTLPQKCS